MNICVKINCLSKAYSGEFDYKAIAYFILKEYDLEP